MFKQNANMACNNILFNVSRINPMHASMEKLYRIAKETKAITGQSALARALVESPQTVKNWEKRGISKGGAIKAQALFGCNVNELLETTKEVHISGVHHVAEMAPPAYLQPKANIWIAAAMEIMQELDDGQRQAMVAKMREYKQFLGPPRDGQALSVAG